MTIQQSIEKLRNDLKTVEDLYDLLRSPYTSPTWPALSGPVSNGNGEAKVVDFINAPSKYHHRWRNELDNKRGSGEDELLPPWAYYTYHGHIFLHEIARGTLVENIPLVQQIMGRECQACDLSRARFFFGKAHGPRMSDGNAFFAALPVLTDLGEDRPSFTLVFQLGLYSAMTNVVLVAEKVENLVAMKNMPWDTKWRDSEDHSPSYNGIVLIDPAELNGPEGKGIKHPDIDLTVRHEFFDALRHFRFLQDLYGIPALGSLRSVREGYPKFLGALI